ncbi:2-polyprenyl-6-methoxyphenol hydroxylase-like FAD-dependent oxidoreductase [Kitasatospora sp. MAP12-15]|uniref:FAD-dependent oxidoreductase n=1 Tax=unclassified Kitasatospora TaxID=2633591 RepID=UPI0024761D4F|nr:FAD-dependent monooxygenase [Kitasatospora sp. MAP12-44]MDH6108417.1 2-polyprenyl-6-methoxyphenol hydroxylase-like FAD-dependent oxidoreductase [Kitasatospora sp. MAP12-44]
MTSAELPATTRVAIVGGGPVGLTLAVTLAEAGIDFVLLDRLTEGANTSRAAVVHARTLEVLEQIGVAEQLIATGLTLDHFSVRDGARLLLRVPFAGLPTRYPHVLLTPQYETEQVLLARLRALGGDLHQPYEVTGVAQDATGVTLTMATGEQLRADYAVGADGMHSVVREAAGIGFTGSAYAQSFVLADVRMDWAPGPSEVALAFGEAGIFVVAPLPRDRYRIVAIVDEAPAEPDLAYVQRLLDERAPGQARVNELIWSSRFRIHHRVADRYRAGRLLLAGDAAHVHSPAGGQGMNTGIQDAYALGRAFATDTLDGYEAQRRPVAVRVVAFTDRLTRIATATGPRRRLRNLVLPLLGHIPAFRMRLARELAELDYR